MHYSINKYEMLQAKCFSERRFHREYKRRSRKKFNSRMMRKWLDEMISKLFEDDPHTGSKSQLSIARTQKTIKSRASINENDESQSINRSPTNRRKSVEEFSELHGNLSHGETFSTSVNVNSPQNKQNQEVNFR